MPFDATCRMAAAIPFAFDDYLEQPRNSGTPTLLERRAARSGTPTSHSGTPTLLERSAAPR